MQTHASVNTPATTSAFTIEEISRFRNDTRGCSHVVHFNNAGASLMPNVVIRAIAEHIELESTIGGYEASALRADAIQQFYTQTGKLIKCDSSNIAFTASATDSFVRALSAIPFQPGDVILTDNDDFISNQIQFLAFEKRFGVRLVRIKNAPAGGVDLEDLTLKLKELKPRLLAITHIPTNSGLVQPAKEIGEIYGQYQRTHGDKTWYIFDACQSIGQMNLDVTELQATGCLWVGNGVRRCCARARVDSRPGSLAAARPRSCLSWSTCEFRAMIDGMLRSKRSQSACALRAIPWRADTGCHRS